MKRVAKKVRKVPARETLTEAYEVRAFRDESEEPMRLIVPGNFPLICLSLSLFLHFPP